MARIQTAKNSSRRETIVATAAQLFKTTGYSATSMRQLAENLGVEAPSLYNHIGSKSELLEKICADVAAEFLQHLDQVEESRMSIPQKLETIIRFHIQTMMTSFHEVFVANHEWKHLPDTIKRDFLIQRRNYERRLMALIDKGIRLGEIRPINSYVAVLTMLSAVRGLEFWHGHQKNVSAEELENEMVQHLLNGLIPQ